MNQNEIALALRIIHEIALAILLGEENPRSSMLKKYGEYGFDIAEQYLNLNKEQSNQP